MNTTLPSVVTVPFHGANLSVIDNDGEPYVPMRPIVEGMGLNWAGQHEKLNGSRFKVCVREIQTQMPGDDQKRTVTCLPLRKLPGWLMSIHPNKVRAELRERIVQYQTECDDVLWQYWNAGHAENPRATAAPAAGALTADQPPANGARVLVVFEGGAVKQTLPVADDATLLSPAHLEEWWRDGGRRARPDLALVRVADLERLEGALGALRGDIPAAAPKARPARARDPETEAWLRKIDAVVPGKPDMSFIRDAAQGRTREARQTSTVATVLAELLASARAGRLVGLAAFASYRDTTYDIIVSHDIAWDPLRTLGGIAELQEETQRVAARARRD